MAKKSGNWLDTLERVGNRLPDASTLFVIGALIVIVLSQIGAMGGWTVQPVQPETVVAADGSVKMELQPKGDPLKVVGLLQPDSVAWMLTKMVENFIKFPPLGVVLVGMLGIGVAERTGLIAALLKAFVAIVPPRFLTPAMVFLGVMSSMGIDAGYIVLPPLAMALYRSVGRSPIVGLAAVFSGVAAGFNANLFITGLDPMLANLTTIGAQVVNADYKVSPTCNWYFMIGSTIVITFTGWFITNRFVEPRFKGKPEDEGGPPTGVEDFESVRKLSPEERKGLGAAATTMALTLAAIMAMILVPGGPLHGKGDHFDRWVEAIVPMILLLFLVPGFAYGFSVKTLQSEKDAARMMTESMAAMAPIIVLAFFASQFIAFFNQSNLGQMLAMWGGQSLAQAQMPPMLLMATFVVVTMLFNLFVGSMSAKYTLFAPIFVPMFMLVGISPELTQAAYRIGDSVTNIITPLNAYLVIILVAMRRYVPKAGMGTLVSTMLPYSIGFMIMWTIMLMAWMASGLPLGPDGPLTYTGGMGK